MRIILLFFITIFLGACTTNKSGFIVPGEYLEINAVYLLEKEVSKYQEISTEVFRELSDRGLTVYFKEDLPDGIAPDVIIKYGTQWQWDVKWYLLDLSIKFYRSDNGFLMASAQSQRTSLVRKNTDSMINEALDELFKLNGNHN